MDTAPVFKTAKTWIEVSEESILHNIKTFQGLASSGAQVMAIVKSNAYGHGLVEVAQIAQKAGVTNFAVDSLEEGLELRDRGVDGRILILGFIRPVNLLKAVENDLSFVAYADEYLEELTELSRKSKLSDKTAKVHLKIETGTVRQGLEGQRLLDFAAKIQGISGVLVEGAYTHFANIEDTSDQRFAKEQLERFNAEIESLKKIGVEPKFKHAACSAAALLFSETHFDLIRLGVSMYGLWSSKETKAVAQAVHADLELRPAMTWKTVIAQLKDIKAGTAVGYGLTEKVSRDTKIAVLPVGYWDGYDRKLSGVGTVLVHGQVCKVVGRICMNMCMIDVTDVEDVSVEDEVVLLGRQGDAEVSAEDLAGKIGTINYEVVTRVNPRIPRRRQEV